MKKYSMLLLTLLIFALCYGQYTLKESYYGAGGPVGASGGSYNLWGSALGQTAVTVVNGGTYKDEQGFYHGEKMMYVYFCAKDTQRAVNGDADSMRIWGGGALDTLKVVVHYLSRGIWKDDTIGIGSTPGTLAVWVDSVQSGDNFWYEKEAVFQSGAGGGCPEGDPCDPNYHRWARADTANNDVAVVDASHAGTQSDPKLVTVDFYEQWRDRNPIVFDPMGTACADSATCGGKVVYVHFKQYGGDSTTTRDNYHTHRDTVRIWADRANSSYDSKLMFSDNTTNDWYTISLHEYSLVNKSFDNEIRYQNPQVAVYANNILWRRYTLFGVPLFPREDTTAYLSSSCAPFTNPLGFGEQDIVLWDDLSATCNPSSGDTLQCGTWETWYRILRYFPSEGSYRRYQGPDGAHNPDRFTPGLGFWGNQVHCDSIPFDVYGVMADTTDSFEIPIWKYNGSNNNTKYNMLANPFYDPQNDTIEVNPSKWRLKHYTTSPTDS